MNHSDPTGPRRLRIGVVTAIPTPYRDPFWNVVSSFEGLDLEVIYCAKNKGDRPWNVSWDQNYQTHYPKAINLASKFGKSASLYWNPDVRGILSGSKFDGLIIGGYNHLTMLWAIYYAKRHGIPYFLASESYLQQSRAKWKHFIKSWFVRLIVTQARGCFPTGALASDYLVHYGARREHLCAVPNIPDVNAFHGKAQELAAQRVMIRRELGLDRVTILFVGRFIEMKGCQFLIEAFRRLISTIDAQLIMLGDGPKRSEWESLVRKLGLTDKVRFEGFQAPESLPNWFAAADLMCLPSTNETWSVVVLEALSSGLPVVVTDRVGCYPNAVTNTTVGNVVSAGSVDSLENGLRSQIEKKVSHSQVHNAWAETRESFSYELVARRLVESLHKWCQ
jgi:glycosyltransferase involved in cell wall biosynthesis